MQGITVLSAKKALPVSTSLKMKLKAKLEQYEEESSICIWIPEAISLLG